MQAQQQALQQQLDALTERNEALLLENLRFRTSGPKLHAAVVRCSSSFSSMRGGVATSLKQFTLALGKDFGELLQAVTAVDIAARVDSRSQEAALERLQSSLQAQLGRLTGMTANFRVQQNDFCSDVPTEVQALSSNLSNWGITTGNSFGTVCGWIEDARFPGAGKTNTTKIDYQQMGYTGTIPTEVSA